MSVSVGMFTIMGKYLRCTVEEMSGDSRGNVHDSRGNVHDSGGNVCDSGEIQYVLENLRVEISIQNSA